LGSRKCLVNASLIAAEGPSALQDKGNLLVVVCPSGRLLLTHMIVEPARFTVLVSPFRFFLGTAHLAETLAKALVNDIHCIAGRFGCKPGELARVRQVPLKSLL
jgi:hypothetical protein